MDTKISELEMTETIAQAPKTITHDFNDLIKRRKEAQEQADTYSAIVKDFDALIKRMEDVGCKTKAEVAEPIEG